MTIRTERRGLDRRHSDRRSPPRSTSDEAWLSAWGDLAQPGRLTGPGAGRAAATEPAGAAVGRDARRSAAGDDPALPRILRTYVAARAALGLALALAPWLGWLAVGGRLDLPVLGLCLAYTVQSLSIWLLRDPAAENQVRERLLPGQWWRTIGFDLGVFSALRLLDPMGQLNYAALLVLPVLMSGVLAQRRLALATAAGAALVLLLGGWWSSVVSGDLLTQMTQAGMAGAGLFMVALVASELAQRLAREERTARSSLEMARQQTLLNRLVIEEMTEGVLVLDRLGRLRAINPAARALLGKLTNDLTLPSPLANHPGLHVLQVALAAAYSEGSWPASAREFTLDPGDGSLRSLQVRARFTRRGGITTDDTPPEDICVLFLEDTRTLQARARQDKLAAMGRMSAGIAHEIRNPLAAISQANALLLEDPLAPPQHQLAAIVADNVRRLKRIVDDVLDAAPGMASLASVSVVDAVTQVAQTCGDWCRAAPAEAQAATRLVCELPGGPLPVRFDAEHLRRVLVNMLDNAARHASAMPGALRLKLAAGPAPGTWRLTLASDGDAIAPEVERHLFEPFFSTRSRGSGLGLYICRELCERHGASIEFVLAPPGARHRNVFGVTLRSLSRD